MASILLKLNNVKKSFKIGNSFIEVLKGISFEIAQGDFAIIFGPSGSGKSTLLHVLLGLEEPSEGEVSFLGENLYLGKEEDDRSVIRKKHVGMVYQQPNWIKSLNVVENVAFPLILLGVEKAESVKQAWKALDQIGMQRWVSYIPTELSGGQQQRVALARALITNPEVIIADEPTGNLDFQAGQDLMQLLMKLNSQGRTIIMVTHDLEYLKYAKRAIQILDGKVVGLYDESNKEQMVENIRGKRGIEKEINASTQESVTTQLANPVLGSTQPTDQTKQIYQATTTNTAQDIAQSETPKPVEQTQQPERPEVVSVQENNTTQSQNSNKDVEKKSDQPVPVDLTNTTPIKQNPTKKIAGQRFTGL